VTYRLGLGKTITFFYCTVVMDPRIVTISRNSYATGGKTLKSVFLFDYKKCLYCSIEQIDHCHAVYIFSGTLRIHTTVYL
jgi:hypothetical protein